MFKKLVSENWTSILLGLVFGLVLASWFIVPDKLKAYHQQYMLSIQKAEVFKVLKTTPKSLLRKGVMTGNGTKILYSEPCVDGYRLKNIIIKTRGSPLTWSSAKLTKYNSYEVIRCWKG